MQDLGIDTEFEVPEDFSEETVDRMAEEFIQYADWLDCYVTDEKSYDKMRDIVIDCINTLAEQNRHINGEVYIDDWDIWESDLNDLVEKRLDDNNGTKK